MADKMADFFKRILVKEVSCCDSWDCNTDKVIVWRQTCNKPYPDPNDPVYISSSLIEMSESWNRSGWQKLRSVHVPSNIYAKNLQNRSGCINKTINDYFALSDVSIDIHGMDFAIPCL